MKRFSFPLQKLLDLREFRERQAELELGKAIAARDAIQLEIEDVARRRVSSAAERSQSTPIRDLLAIEHYIRRLDVKKEELLEDLASAELIVENKRELYMVATRERQILTKLREKKSEAWKKEYLNEEASVLDDISNSRARASDET